MRSLIGALMLSGGLLLAAPASAATVGQPLLIAEDSLAGSTLDFFDEFGPTGLNIVSLSGQISQVIGAPDLVGSVISFTTDHIIDAEFATLTVGTTTLDEFHVIPTNTTGSYDFDPFQEGPGDLNFRFLILPPIASETPNADDPSLYDYTYGGAFADYPERTAIFPEFEVLLSVYLDSPVPTKIYNEIDPDTGEILFSTTYFEGPLDVSRLTLGVIGGAPVPPVPLPAPLALLIGGLGALSLLKVRRI